MVCSTCLRPNMPDHDGKGHCITCARELTLHPIVLEQHNGITVLRDDMLLGGTKSTFIELLIPQGVSEVVYASPVYGGFQIALAGVCETLGLQATIFTPWRKVPHRNTLEAKEHGAKIMQVKAGYLSNIQAKARAYCQYTGAHLLPFGANDPTAINAIARRMRMVSELMGGEPAQVWCAWGSGTLARGIHIGTTKATVNAVVVGKQPGAEWQDVGRLILRKQPLKFEQAYRGPFKPPFTSTPNYDAKAWAAMQECAPVGNILFWNVL